jgi:hypothetical protein
MVNVDHIKQSLKEYFQIMADEPWSPDQGIHVHEATGVVDIKGSVTLRDPLLKLYSPLPIKFGHVSGNFNISLNAQYHLFNLENFPHTVEGNFRVQAPRMTSLQGAPRHVGGVCAILSKSLMSLEHLPKTYARMRLEYTPHLPLLRLVDEQVVYWNYSPEYGGMLRGTVATSIIERHRGEGKTGALKAAAELIRAGFKENARW